MGFSPDRLNTIERDLRSLDLFWLLSGATPSEEDQRRKKLDYLADTLAELIVAYRNLLERESSLSQFISRAWDSIDSSGDNGEVYAKTYSILESANDFQNDHEE